jgi:hypothetical protein
MLINIAAVSGLDETLETEAPGARHLLAAQAAAEHSYIGIALP